MKKNLLTPLYLVAVIAIIGTSWSCTKESASTPASQQTSLTSQAVQSSEDALDAGEIVSAQVVPGIYGILKFIDTGDDITSSYNGYTFEFKADGTLVATTNLGDIFTGTWKLNTAQTRMAINIHGNAKLNNLSDDSWRVARITNKKINLKKPGPDQVIFVMQ
jgi:hypothetical protein